MIARHSFSKEWIVKQRERHSKADPLLIERQIYAFELLCLLVMSGKPFVFKGGTALLLLLPAARRLSIDIDIVGNFTFDELVALVEGSTFTRVEEHERKKGASRKDTSSSIMPLSLMVARHTYCLMCCIPLTGIRRSLPSLL